MSSADGSPRSRSPKGEKAKGSAPDVSAAAADDPDSWTEQILDAIETKMDKKNNDFKENVKKVVNSLVGKQIERLGTKIDHNRKNHKY